MTYADAKDDRTGILHSPSKDAWQTEWRSERNHFLTKEYQEDTGSATGAASPRLLDSDIKSNSSLKGGLASRQQQYNHDHLSYSLALGCVTIDPKPAMSSFDGDNLKSLNPDYYGVGWGPPL